MNDLITIKSGALGTRGEMPKLTEDELGYITDKEELYIGTKAGNKRLCGAGDEARIKALEDKPEYYSKDEEDAIISDIKARLDALEAPSEQGKE